MNEDPMRDMVPPENKSIRNISLDRSKQGENVNGGSSNEDSLDRPQRPHLRERSGLSTWWMWVLGIIILIFIFLSLTPFLTKAEVLVTPRHQRVEINGSFEASGAENPDENSDLLYDTVTIEISDSAEVEAVGEEEVSERATGRITIFNEFSSEPERLIANTRFESKDGLIFRISDPIVVPGYSEASGEIVPGKIEVQVTADQAGERYNIGPSEFSVPGLAGDPRFEQIYAESQSGMSGGFEGTKKVAEEEDINAARESLRESLQNNLQTEVSSKIPDDFVFFTDAAEIDFQSPPTKETTEGKVLVTETAVVLMPIFNKRDLAEFVATQTIGSYDGEEVRIQDFEKMNVELSDNEEDGQNISLQIEGSPLLIWVVDMEDLRDELLGLERDEVEGVLSDRSAIEEVSINLSPFWKRTMPEDVEKLSVTEIIPD